MEKQAFSVAGFLMGLLFPPRCLCCQKVTGKEGLCQDCEKGLFPIGPDPCPFCGRDKDCCRCGNGKDFVFQKTVSAYYYDQTGRKLLHRFKFQKQTACCHRLLPELLRRLKGEELLQEGDWLVVPVPMWQKERSRFDQTAYLARELSKKLGIVLRRDLLKKPERTAPQHKQPANKRQENVKGAFLAGETDLEGANILLVDDVATTFSTLNECAAQLKKAGAGKILCATLLSTAHKPKDERGST